MWHPFTLFYYPCPWVLPASTLVLDFYFCFAIIHLLFAFYLSGHYKEKRFIISVVLEGKTESVSRHHTWVCIPMGFLLLSSYFIWLDRNRIKGHFGDDISKRRVLRFVHQGVAALFLQVFASSPWSVRFIWRDGKRVKSKPSSALVCTSRGVMRSRDTPLSFLATYLSFLCAATFCLPVLFLEWFEPASLSSAVSPFPPLIVDIRRDILRLTFFFLPWYPVSYCTRVKNASEKCSIYLLMPRY